MKFCSKLKGDDRKKFIILDITYTISGILLLTTGITLKCIFLKYSHFLFNSLFYFTTLIIVLGSLVLLLPILAYYGFARGIFFKIIFFVPLIVILVYEIQATVQGFQIVRHIDWNSRLRYPIRYEYSDEPLAVLWNIVQSEFHCCGSNSSRNWKENLPVEMSKQLPLSCCRLPADATDFKCANGKDVYPIGCKDPFQQYIIILVAIAASLLLISFIAQVAAALLLLKKTRLNCSSFYSQVYYRSYDCNCKTIAFVSKGCTYQKHLICYPKEENHALLSESVDHEANGNAVDPNYLVSSPSGDNKGSLSESANHKAKVHVVK